jgi:hypothetical protein
MDNIIVEDLPEDKQPVQSPQAAARTDSIAHLALSNRFNIDMPTDQENKQLAEIWAYAKGVANSQEISDIVWEVVHLEGVLGAPKLGETRLNRLYRYCKLKRQEAEIQRELKNATGVRYL